MDGTVWFLSVKPLTAFEIGGSPSQGAQALVGFFFPSVQNGISLQNTVLFALFLFRQL